MAGRDHDSGANLAVLGEGLRQQEPDEEQVGAAEDQGKQSGVQVEELSMSGVDSKVGPHQRSHGEAQREGDADHSLTAEKNTCAQHTSLSYFAQKKAV